MLAAGEMDRLLTIESPSVTRDPATGAQAVAWATFAQVWGKVTETASALRGIDEKLMDGVMVYGRPTSITTRWLPGVDATMRINDSGTLLQIVGVAMIGRREGLELACAAWSHE